MAFLRSQRNNWKFTTDRNVDMHRIPPLPARVVMTDRADGTLWFLTFSTIPTSIDGLGFIGIESTLPTFAPGDFRIYAANDGPILRTLPVIKLLVRGGYLGYEEIEPAPWEGERSNARVMARSGVQRSLREIIIPSTYRHSPDLLGWDDVEAVNG